MQKFYSNGKLLITGEYLVLDGALALAIPSKYGQSLSVESIENRIIEWQSLDHKEQVWYSNTFDIKDATVSSIVKNDITERLLSIFKVIQDLNKNTFSSQSGLRFTSKMNFANDWGLGSSSTLINNLATWAKVDPYLLLETTFGGSGYDIACARSNSPIAYGLSENRIVEEVNFNPVFKDQLFFIYLNRKQNSREAINSYKTKWQFSNEVISEISAITTEIIQCKSLLEFEGLLETHETIVSQVLKTPTIKKQLFPNYKGLIKSLGGWGGDFILASGKAKDKNYFIDKGYNTIIDYSDMVLAKN